MPRIIVPICLHSGQTIAKLLTNRDSKKLLTDHNISFEFIDKSIGTVNICETLRGINKREDTIIASMIIEANAGQPGYEFVPDALLKTLLQIEKTQQRSGFTKSSIFLVSTTDACLAHARSFGFTEVHALVERQFYELAKALAVKMSKTAEATSIKAKALTAQTPEERGKLEALATTPLPRFFYPHHQLSQSSSAICGSSGGQPKHQHVAPPSFNSNTEIPPRSLLTNVLSLSLEGLTSQPNPSFNMFGDRLPSFSAAIQSMSTSPLSCSAESFTSDNDSESPNTPPHKHFRMNTPPIC